MGELEKRSLESLADEINEAHFAFGATMNKALDHALRCGELLVEAKSRLPHGAWLGWLSQHFQGSIRSAQGYMKIFDRRDELLANAQHVAHLTMREALGELAAPQEAASDAPAQADEEKNTEVLAAHDTTAHPTDLEALRAKLKKEREARERAEREIERAKRERESLRFDRETVVAEVEIGFAEEMAALKAKYGEVDEPRFAHFPPEHWEQMIREAKSQRVMNVAKHLYQMYTWPDWMQHYFPIEAAEAMLDFEAHEDFADGIRFIVDWLEKMLDEWEELRNE